MIIVTAGGERRELADTIGEPGSFGGQVNEAAFDDRAVGVQPHDLVAFVREARDAGEAGFAQVLDQLRAGGLVLDEDRRSLKPPIQFDDGALQGGKVDFSAIDASRWKLGPLSPQVVQTE